MTWVVLWEAWNLAFGRASLFLAAALPDGWRGGSWLYGEGVPSEGYAIALALVNLTVLVLVLHWLESSRAGGGSFGCVARHDIRCASPSWWLPSSSSCAACAGLSTTCSRRCTSPRSSGRRPWCPWSRPGSSSSCSR